MCESGSRCIRSYTFQPMYHAAMTRTGSVNRRKYSRNQKKHQIFARGNIVVSIAIIPIATPERPIVGIASAALALRLYETLVAIAITRKMETKFTAPRAASMHEAKMKKNSRFPSRWLQPAWAKVDVIIVTTLHLSGR